MRLKFETIWPSVGVLNVVLPIIVALVLRSAKYIFPSAGGIISIIWISFGLWLLVANIVLGKRTTVRAYYVFGALNVLSFAFLGEVSFATGLFTAYLLISSLL